MKKLHGMFPDAEITIRLRNHLEKPIICVGATGDYREPEKEIQSLIGTFKEAYFSQEAFDARSKRLLKNSLLREWPSLEDSKEG
ncbi:hypothetical protein L4X63_09495 [Geomonas sp. Red32]|uniref:hypothetical protein n=1 Tax=Geomonas sp. Red32 TaxID=2912856 RepID=UPI00202CB94C|nr:hypothetical protein [Geomonas sp. Red32]MCM0081822.1 hypothetical protein [Geomonas sp. Red32]